MLLGGGGAENDGHENDRLSKLQDMKLQNMKLTSSLLRSGFASTSGTTSEKWGGHFVRACRACRQAREHVTIFSCAKMHGLDSVSCRVVTRRAKWNLGLWERNAFEHDDCLKIASVFAFITTSFI